MNPLSVNITLIVNWQMKFLKLIPFFLVLLGIFPFAKPSISEIKDTKNYKVLSSENKKLSIKNVKAFLNDGDNLIQSGNFDQAKEKYDLARNLAKQLAGFYRDLNVSFKGIDARIPLELDKKGREAIKIWAESNSRLAALYTRKKQPEVAVPLLVEIVRLMSPKSTEGKKAYDNLIQLGFVDTSYKGI
tara:strand:+ start:147 stop:710 length:564 start_codon:yes stop_codon:yes gene_type:complete